MSEEEIRNIIEAALLAAGKPLTVAELAQLFDEALRPDSGAVRAALERLGADYAQRALEIKETAAGFRVQVRSRYAPMIARLWPERQQRYSRALLETLALIAYRQPITRAEIEAVRGVVVNPNIIRTLLERQWIRVVGTRDLPGRPELLGTTRDFLDYFGLRSLDELPPLTQLRALGELDPHLELPVSDAEAGVQAGAEVDAEADAEADADGPGAYGAEAESADVDGESDAEPGPVGAVLVASAPIADS